MTRISRRRRVVSSWSEARHDTCPTCGHGSGLVLGLPFPSLAAAQRTGRRWRDRFLGWAEGLVRAPVRFTVTADDPEVLTGLAACAPPGVRARCVRARVRIGSERHKLVRMYVDVRGRADVTVLRRWLLDGLRHYEGDVRINGVLVDRTQRRLRDA